MNYYPYSPGDSLGAPYPYSPDASLGGVPYPSPQPQTQEWGGMGPTPVPNPFTPQGQPEWMQGAWSAPWWGMSAANPQQALTQQDLMYQEPQAPPVAPAQQEDPRSRLVSAMMRTRDEINKLRQQYDARNTRYFTMFEP